MVIAKPSDETMRRLRLESALKKQEGCKRGCLLNATCEVCGSIIRTYCGPLEGVICSSCFRPAFTHGLVRDRQILAAEQKGK